MDLTVYHSHSKMPQSTMTTVQCNVRGKQPTQMSASILFWHLFSPFIHGWAWRTSLFRPLKLIFQLYHLFCTTHLESHSMFMSRIRNKIDVLTLLTCVYSFNASLRQFPLRLFYCVFLFGHRIVSIEATSYNSITSLRPSADLINNHYFKVKPSDVYVTEGESAEFKCQINPDTDAGSVQWAKDGFLLGYEPIIPGHDRYTMLVNQSTRTYNLHIQNAQLIDEGEFECQTSGSISSSAAKQPIRASAYLHLIVSPKTIFINSSRSFDNPSASVSSTVSRSYLNTSSQGFGSQDLTSWYANASSENSPNTFTIEAHESEKIVIVCAIPYSKPPPRLKWYRKNIELLPEAAKTTVSKTLLANRHTLFSVESSLVLYPKADEEYKCQAEHPGLSKPLRATAQINIFKRPNPPVIEGYKNGDVVNFQEKLTLKCSSTNGYPPPSVIWLRNGVEIDRSYFLASRYEVVNSLSFVVDQNDNLAQYTCQVMNTLTPIPLRESVTLNVLLFPTQIQINAPTQVLFSDNQGIPVTLECTAHPASPKPNESKIRWLIDGKEVDLEDGHYAHIVKHDHQSWTIRSNLTFVVNSKEPSVRNIVCIAYSTNSKSETVSATHRISVNYPPEMPSLFGVQNGLATVVAGEIFKCKCVCYSGNPKASLVWLNHQNREISALTTTTGSGTSSELVIRPSPKDHGSVFRCHVLHPALEKPYEVSFTLQVLFPPDQLNITFPKFIKENDTIKIECTTSPSNPCPSVSLLKDGKKMDENNDVIIERLASASQGGNNRVMRVGANYAQYDDDGIGDMDDSQHYDHRQDISDAGGFGADHVSSQSVPRQSIIYKTDCDALHSSGRSNDTTGTQFSQPQSVKTVFVVIATPEDDGSEITCIANNPLIPSHVIRVDKTLSVQYKPKLPINSHFINYVELNEHESHRHSIGIRANPPADNLVFSRVKETTADSYHSLNSSSTDASSTHLDLVNLALNELIYSFDNTSWLFEPIPAQWSASLSRDNIVWIDIRNVSLNDAGLYAARLSNSLGDSMFFVRLVVRTVSAIDSISLYSYSEPANSNQSNVNNRTVREEDKYLRIECTAMANPSITVKWKKQSLYGDFLTNRNSNLDNFTTFGYSSSSELNSISLAESNHNLVANHEDSNIDWSRSNVSQYVRQNLHNGGARNSSHYLTSELVVYNVSPADSGVYTCVTPNDTRSIQVKVEHYPRIVAQLNSFKVAADNGTPFVKFVCSAIAYPSAHFNWTVNGNKMISEAKVNNDDKYKVISRNVHHHTHLIAAESPMSSYYFASELIIRRVSREDFRSYQCVAYNHLGTNRASFELVAKRYPDPPSQLHAVNVTHNSVFLTWKPGFDYGHEQIFQIKLWSADRDQIEKSLNWESDLSDSSLARTFANISVNYFLVSSLESESYYKVAVFARNKLGNSTKSAYLTFQTLSAQSYQLKPVYASADEQKLNGLISNKIIGEDFLELTVFLCLIVLVVISFVTSIILYCHKRRKRQNQHSHQPADRHTPSKSSLKNECSAKLIDTTTSDSSKYPLNYADYTTESVMTPTASSTMSNNITAIGMSSDLCNTNSLSTNSSYVIKEDFIQPMSSPLCRSINLTTASVEDFALDPIDNHSNHSKYLSKAKRAYCQNILTIPSPVSTVDSFLEKPSQTAIYPYELTNSSPLPNQSNDSNSSYDKVQFVLSHQQITNVHLLPNNLDTANETICLGDGTQSQLTDGYISFSPLQYNTSPGDKSTNICSLPLTSFDLKSQFSLDSGSNSISSPSSNVSRKFAYVPGNFNQNVQIGDNCLLVDSPGHVNFDMAKLPSNLDLYELERETNQSLSDNSSSHKFKSTSKRVNFVKPSSSLNTSTTATLTTLNEEDEV